MQGGAGQRAAPLPVLIMVVEPPTQRLALDVREVRDRTRLRVLASLPALLGGAWLAWVGDGWLLRTLAAAGLVFATIWLVLARRSGAQLAHAEEHYLDIGTDALQVRAGSQARTLAWSDVEAVEIDEDRLVVLLRVRGVRPLAVEPMYGGLTLAELAATLQRARAGAGVALGGDLSEDTGTTPGMRSSQS